MTILSYFIKDGKIGISDDHKNAVKSLDGKDMDPASLGGFLAYFDGYLRDHNLLTLLRSNTPWNSNKEIALNVMKEKLIQAPMRTLVNFKRKLHMFTDASETGFSCMLLQESECGKHMEIVCLIPTIPNFSQVLHRPNGKRRDREEGSAS